VEQAVAVGEQEDGKVLYLGPDRAGKIVSVVRDDGDRDRDPRHGYAQRL